MSDGQIKVLDSFEALTSTLFEGATNALCWKRDLIGDFSEIVQQVTLKSNMVELGQDELRSFDLSKQGKNAREIILNDLEMLTSHGASPTLNLIKHYEKDDAFPFFPTDVYSFHVDRSPIPTDTFLCTYSGDSSEILPNEQAQQKNTHS